MKNKKITINDLAVMVQKGFEGVQGQINGIHEEIGGVKGEAKKFRSEVNDQFLNVNARLDTIQLDFSTMRDDRHRIKLLEDDVAVLKRK